MISLRDVVIFLAGMEFLHTLSHIFMAFFVTLPVDFKFVVLTPTMNTWAIFVNAAITIALLWWASRLPK